MKKKIKEEPGITKIELRDYQRKIVGQGAKILSKNGMLYLAMEVRTGKTATALTICDAIASDNVLFVTKKKVVSGIEKDHKALDCSFKLTCLNYESLHKLEGLKFDVIICDEAHTLGAFPKPSKRTKQLKDLVTKHKAKVIFLSGTPTPESHSQMYHQFYVHPDNPFKEYSNFYRWSNDYVDVKSKFIGSMRINDYSRALKNKIMEKVDPLMITYTQEAAGFESKINEIVYTIPMKDATYALCNKLKKDLVIQGKEDVILADTGAKLMSKLHQMYSGTVILESGKTQILDDSKALFIKNTFKGKKIGIFYKFKAEWEILKKEFGDNLTDDLDVFNSTDKNIALQIQSGREGISLRNADVLVYFNIDFSAVSYWQSRDRMTTIDRKFNDIYWIFSKGGIEERIYKTVQEKKDYTLSYFKKHFLS
jgi:superfamily II DNA or RNA helicase